MARALIGLGSNLGDRPSQLAQALQLLCSGGDCQVLRRSRWYRVQPVGGPPDQPLFLNGAAVLETSLDPEQLHAKLLAVEAQLGRQRSIRWGARTIDLDLLLYDDQQIDSAALKVPHPRMSVRRFVMVPAAEIAADWVHPALGWTLGRLLGHLDSAAPYLAVTGPPTAGKSALARHLAAETGATLLSDPPVAPFIAAIDAAFEFPTEEQLVENRLRVLAAIESGGSKWFVSDFWIGQSLVFTEAFLPTERTGTFSRWWEQAVASVAQPKLLVALDASGPELWRHLVTQDRVDEQDLDVPQFETLRRAFARQLARPWGPLLHLSGTSADEALQELQAALAAIDTPCVAEPE